MSTQQRPPKNDTGVLLDYMARAYDRHLTTSLDSFAGDQSLMPTKLLCRYLGRTALGHRHPEHNAQTILETAGMKFLGIVEEDPIFQRVELPAGWRKVQINHDTWTEFRLLDDQRRRRADIVFHPEPYKRGATLTLRQRFSVWPDYEQVPDYEQQSTTGGVVAANVFDWDGSVVQRFETPQLIPDPRVFSEAMKKIRGDAEIWLTQNYPDWANPGVHWH